MNRLRNGIALLSTTAALTGACAEPTPEASSSDQSATTSTTRREGEDYVEYKKEKEGMFIEIHQDGCNPQLTLGSLVIGKEVNLYNDNYTVTNQGGNLVAIYRQAEPYDNDASVGPDMQVIESGQRRPKPGLDRGLSSRFTAVVQLPKSTEAQVTAINTSFEALKKAASNHQVKDTRTAIENVLTTEGFPILFTWNSQDTEGEGGHVRAISHQGEVVFAAFKSDCRD